ncbi:hypothetical protein JAAARDRAFT_30127 [Jaapia argillacea MUCL 33604]|uniref:RRM domain-containing protein n=1 Tax=Jaapia argillacea MUCL 33604 TaxID=933084 RepID=A0A067Q5B2_9AGAM|nr:hypothetical protein JAAARDRAFT_30127 [Jaapia argillacea MUCL 33604]
MSHSVNVTGIAPQTAEQHLHDFFTFCGKITSIDFKEGPPKSATIYFEKPSAAKTALMLNGGTLDGAHLTVVSEKVHPDDDNDTPHHAGETIEQEVKPRAGIAAEYLARGYTLSDNILEQAIKMDNERGISKRFLSYFNSLDTTVGSKALGPQQTISGKVQETFTAATQQARTVDQQRGISKTATDYYQKALSSPLGKKVWDFYTTTTKQVLDIHEEARRIADQQKLHGHGHHPHHDDAPAPAAVPAAGGPEASTQAAPTVV